MSRPTKKQSSCDKRSVKHNKPYTRYAIVYVRTACIGKSQVNSIYLPLRKYKIVIFAEKSARWRDYLPNASYLSFFPSCAAIYCATAKKGPRSTVSAARALAGLSSVLSVFCTKEKSIRPGISRLVF
jgi:hypothetical protein